MKKLSYIILITLFSANAKGQVFKPINDNAIVAHYKRMVFAKWGDFQPEPEYKRSITSLWLAKQQVSMNASLLWGYNYRGLPLGDFVNSVGIIDVDRNRAYRDGEDIRPLKTTGLQNRRLAEREIQKKEDAKIQEETDDLAEKAQNDFMHYKGGIIKSEPLWLLYYKNKLKDLERIPDNPTSYGDWGLDNDKIFSKIKSAGGIAVLQEKLDLIKEDFKVAKTANIPRGKRILLLHKCLMDWRKFKKEIENYNNSVGKIIEIEKKINKGTKSFESYEHKSDLEIIKAVIEENKDNF